MEVYLTIIFGITIFILLAILFRYLELKKIVPFPYIIPVVFIFIFVSVIFFVTRETSSFSNDIINQLLRLNTIKVERIVDILIPGLLLISTHNSNLHIFIHEKYKVLILAIPGVIFQSLLFSSLTFFLDETQSYLNYLLVGCILSATDPVTVVSVLEEYPTLLKLSTLIEGESLLNDSTVIIFSAILTSINTNKSSSENNKQNRTKKEIKITQSFNKQLNNPESFIQEQSVEKEIKSGNSAGGWDITLDLIKEILFPILLAYTFSLFTRLVAHSTKHLFPLSTLLVFFNGYLLYFILEYLIEATGILGVALYGLLMGYYKNYILGDQQQKESLVFQEGIDFVLNTTLFFCLTSLFMASVFQVALFNSEGSNSAAYFEISSISLTGLYFYFMSTVCRFALVFLLYPMFTMFGYRSSASQLVILSLSGLKGLISVSLSFQLFTSSLEDKTLFIAITLATFLSIVINSLLVKLMVSVFNLDSMSAHDLLIMKETKLLLEEEKKRVLHKLRKKIPVEDISLDTWAAMKEELICLGVNRRPAGEPDDSRTNEWSVSFSSTEKDVMMRAKLIYHNRSEKKFKEQEFYGIDIDNKEIAFRLLKRELLRLEAEERVSSGVFQDLFGFLSDGEDNRSFASFSYGVVKSLKIDSFFFEVF